MNLLALPCSRCCRALLRSTRCRRVVFQACQQSALPLPKPKPYENVTPTIPEPPPSPVAIPPSPTKQTELDTFRPKSVSAANIRSASHTHNWSQWRPLQWRLVELPGLWLELSKPRLSALVVATAVCGYLVAVPPPITVASLTSLGGCAAGTALMSASANSFNQFMEVPYDAQMRRTQARILVRGRLAPVHAAVFGVASSVVGFTLLWAVCTPLTATLGVCNVLIYAGVYTPLKRSSVACTWAGALVGAIPPLMGWAAATGDDLTTGGWAAAATMGAVLFAWQFPHFNSLSWNLRGDYSKAGYRVMCVVNPSLCKRTTLRYSVALLGICSIAAPLTELTSWTFAVDSIPLNAYLIYLSYKFYNSADSASSRKLFRYSLFYLPAIMLLMIVSADSKSRSHTDAKSLDAVENIA